MLHLPRTNALIRGLGSTRDAALACCCCPSFHVWGDLYMHSVITEAQCVTNEKFNETLSMDQRPGPRPQTDYEISYFLSQYEVFFISAQYGRLRNPLLSCSTAVPQCTDNTTWALTEQRHCKLMGGNTDWCHLIQLWSLFIVWHLIFSQGYKDVQMMHSWDIYYWDPSSFPLNARSKCRKCLSTMDNAFMIATCILSQSYCDVDESSFPICFRVG